MADICVWKYVAGLVVVCVMLVVYGHLNSDVQGKKVVKYEEAIETQDTHKREDEVGDNEKDYLTVDELYKRQLREFINPLGYYDDELDDMGNTENHLDSQDNHEDLRRRRSATGSDAFSIIAGLSGGSVIHTDKDNISSAVDVLTSATLPSPVLLSKWSISVKSNWTGAVHVDSSVYNLAVEIQTSCCRPVVAIFDPTGRRISSTDPNVTVTANTSTILHTRIGQPAVGKWTLKVEDNRNQTYDINVRGSSPTDFDASPVSKDGTPVSGQPEAGNNSTYMKVEPDGSVSNWTYLVVIATNGTILQRIPMGRPKGSRTLRWYIVKVVWPNLDVYVGVQGLDKSGHVLTRVQPTMVLPSGIRLVLLNPTIEYITTCDRPTVLMYSVKNAASPADFTAKCLADQTNFTSTVSPSSFHLDNLFSHDINCTVTLKPEYYHDTAVNVNLQIIPKDGRTQYLQHNLIIETLDCRPNSVSTTSRSPFTADAGSTPSLNSFSVTMTTDKNSDRNSADVSLFSMTLTSISLLAALATRAFPCFI